MLNSIREELSIKVDHCVGNGKFVMAFTLVCRGLIPWWLILCPKNSIDSFPKLHLLGFIVLGLYSCSFSKTWRRWI